MSAAIKADICVIGAGAGGLSVAAGAAQLGASVVLIEAGEMGGDCLNHGCIPSKSLLAVAKAAQDQRKPVLPGLSPHEPSVDFSAAKSHIRSVIEAIAPHDSQERFEGLGVRVIRSFGRFVSPREVEADGQIIRARRFVIATGSSPLVPPIPGLDEVTFETNESIFDLPDCPEHLLIIGGGPIGLEMAQAHQRLGAKVTVIEAAMAFGKDDPELAQFALNKLRDEGVDIVEGVAAERVYGKSGSIVVKGNDGREFEGSHLLIAVGRKPNVDGLGLDAAGIIFDRTIKVNRGLRTSNRRVYAIGDVASHTHFTHLAGYHAGLVVRSALFGLPVKVRDDHIPWVTYTQPELAHVGLLEAEARNRYGDALSVIRQPFEGNDRARANGKPTGMLKLLVVKGRPVGVSIVGENAGELVGLWSLAISARLNLSAIASMIVPYPTLGDISKQAAGAYFAPRLFDSTLVKTLVRLVNSVVP